MKRILFFLLMISLCVAVPAQQRKTQRKTTTVQQATKKRPVQTTQKQTTQKSTTQKRATQTTQKKQQQSKGKPQEKKQPPTIKGLQKERSQVQAQRAANQRKQEELKRNVKRGMENLMALDVEIAEKRKVVDTIRNDLDRLTSHINLLDRQLEVLNEELEDRRMRYMKSMRYMHRNRSVQNQLMFIFSADNFNQMYRRLRFSREYAAYQKAQGEAVKSKQHQVEQKKQELSDSKQEKSRLLARGEQEQKQLEGKQNEQQVQVEKLKKQQKTVEALIIEQQRREAELNAHIDKLIAEEIAREKARQEAEARKRAAEEAAKKRVEEQANKKTGENHRTDKKAKETTTTRKKETPEPKKSEENYTMPAEERLLSGSFEANKGRLPIPITGAYQLIRGFGAYSPEGLSHVTLQSNGWHLKGQKGAKAQCIFDGEVSGVYLQGGSYIVTVRHGRYISAYINLSSVSVRKGQRVKTRETLGALSSDQTMQFQLRNWNTLLNPRAWIRR